MSLHSETEHGRRQSPACDRRPSELLFVCLSSSLSNGCSSPSHGLLAADECAADQSPQTVEETRPKSSVHSQLRVALPLHPAIRCSTSDWPPRPALARHAPSAHMPTMIGCYRAWLEAS